MASKKNRHPPVLPSGPVTFPPPPFPFKKRKDPPEIRNPPVVYLMNAA